MADSCLELPVTTDLSPPRNGNSGHGSTGEDGLMDVPVTFFGFRMNRARRTSCRVLQSRDPV